MRRLLVHAALALVILAPGTLPASASPFHHPPPTWAERWQECRFQTLRPGSWTDREVELTIRCADRRFPVDLAHALYVAHRESGDGLYAGATNSSSGACGIYQHIPRYWPGRLASLRSAHPHLGPFAASCFNARSNVLTSIHMAHHTGWGPWGG